jgi:2,4-dienoyl-CoA reductase-like NADH-dependent reductase (Old Yellow Enzyme family)/thioredoxin reductase
MNPYYPNLLSPLKVGNITLKNRICVAPMNLREVDHNGGYTARTIAFNERLARGGVALITMGEACVSQSTGSSESFMLRITNPGAYFSLCDLAESVHRWGAKISMEMSHAGALCIPDNNFGNQPMGPIAYVKPSGVAVREMTEEDMIQVAEDFGNAALTLKNAGFDMVQFHAGHGWLIHQFLSPRTNKRTDKYGGSLENRCRFPIMCLENIRKKVGKNFPVDMRMTGDEIIEGGYHIDEGIKIAKMLAPYVDMIQVSTGGIFHPDATARMSPGVFMEKNTNVCFATAIKEMVDIPVSTVAAINEPDSMEAIIRDNQADLILMGRGLICEPDMVKKLSQGHMEDCNRCLRCNECHNRLFAKNWFLCTLNPEIGFENRLPVPEPSIKKDVLVVGGGPGGMMAALTAAKRGHTVTLCEKGDELGGAIRFADHVSFKRDMAYWRHQMEKRLADSNVTVKLNTLVTTDLVNQMKPDVLIVAVGADPAKPPIPGLDNPKVIVGATMHYAPQNYGDKVVVIGGGLIGCESAAELHAEGRDVTVVEMLPGIAPGCGQAQSNALRVGMQGVKVRTSTACKRITDEGVWVQAEGKDEELIPADSVILSAGMRPRTALVEELQKATVPEFYAIGDCAAARKMGDAIREGYYTALNL